MRFHQHPRGEEIFVLKGTLCDKYGRYAAATWQRFPPGTGHAPFAETETLIHLRNGYLQAVQSNEAVQAVCCDWQRSQGCLALVPGTALFRQIKVATGD
jgi:anti-sigma factor ChrR (cupin superfamily)